MMRSERDGDGGGRCSSTASTPCEWTTGGYTYVQR
jgi:hypothetical protein